MQPKEIRQSLSYHEYIDHARSLKLAADENNKAFYNIVNESMDENNRLKGLGLMRASLMLYAISIELTLKGVALYHERENILLGEIKTFDDFIKKYKTRRGNGHEFLPLIKYYKIKLSDSELNLVNHLQSYNIWAGRFPFPKKEIDIIPVENNTGSHGSSLGLSYIEDIDRLIENQFKKLTPL